MEYQASCALSEVNANLVQCRLCPRLVTFRESVIPRASFRGQEYWRRPVPGFGDPAAWLLVLGLAPAAHGGNRTGRVFTGDASARFLFKVLFRAGLANQPTSLSRDDGLVLNGCYVTAAVRCVPPGDRPAPDELRNCSTYLRRELEALNDLRAVVALGGLAFKAYLDIAKGRGVRVRGARFSHGRRYDLDPLPRLYCAYHPSPRNVNTGKLTEGMLLGVLRRARKESAPVKATGR